MLTKNLPKIAIFLNASHSEKDQIERQGVRMQGSNYEKNYSLSFLCACRGLKCETWHMRKVCEHLLTPDLQLQNSK
jgi:hypothetical protein